MKRTTIASFGICLGLMLMLCIVLYGLLDMSAAAQWPLPHHFYGDIEIDGQPAPVGTVVEARGEGVVIGIDGNPMTTDEIGKYGGPSGTDPHLLVQGYIDGGTPIEFYVNDVRARCYDPATEEWVDTYPFQSDALTELDLFLTGEYTLTVTSAGCCPISVTCDTITATVAAGETEAFTPITGGLTVTLEAMTGIYCDFDGWGGDVVTTANPITILMRSDVTITATCINLTEHTLTIHQTGSGNGAVAREPDQALYIYGTVVTLTATPSQTSTFGDWSGDVPGGLSEINPVAITMDGDKEITATFNFYSVTVSPEADEKPGSAGEPVVYMLQVFNTGGVVDTFVVTAVSSNGWTVIAPQSVEVVAAGDEWVFVGPQIPPDVISGTVDVVTFTVTSQGDPRKSATALLTTTVTQGYVPEHKFFLPLVMKNATGFGAGF